jgi:hypothetical protein
VKQQYLGDSKDSFKWDYHDWVVSKLGYPVFNVVLMMTPDDGGNDGKSHPTLFPARDEIIGLCHDLRERRCIEEIKNIAKKTGSSYVVTLHQGDSYITNKNRREYFSGFSSEQDQIVFLDPDNGLEPETSFSEKHVRYSDITRVLDQLSNESIITVFQHFRRISFKDDFSRIRKRIESGHSTAIYWHSLMFVAISRSEKAIERTLLANQKYSESNPVEVIA